MWETLEDYEPIPHSGGPDHVVHEIREEDYRPVDLYPQLLPWYELQLEAEREPMVEEYKDSAWVNADVAEYALSESETFYFMRCSSFSRILGPETYLFYETPEGIAELWYAGGDIVAIMDTQTNGFPDIAPRQGGHFYPLIQYDGVSAYRYETPSHLYVTRVTSSLDDYSLEDGILYWDPFIFWHAGDQPAPEYQPCYIGAKYEELEGLLAEEYLWLRHPDGRLVEYSREGYSTDTRFSAKVLDEAAVRERIAHEVHPDGRRLSGTHLWPSDYIFAYLPQDE